jgi:putative membrane protein
LAAAAPPADGDRVSTLSLDERQRVEAAVAAAETRTSAEFAVVVARASDPYAAFPLFWSAILALVAGGVVALAVPSLSGAAIFAIQASLFVVTGLILQVQPLRYWLVPHAIRHEHARRLARLQFGALVQDRTQGDVGLLLFLSLAERHVEILVDRALADRIAQPVWQTIIDDLVPEVRAGRVAAGLVAAIQRCTALLEKHFPAAPGSQNEIPDRVTEV